MDLENKRFIRVGTNDDDELDKDLYMTLQKEMDEFCFKVNKAGNYYYANTKELFDSLNIDYKKKTIMYDIVEMEYE